MKYVVLCPICDRQVFITASVAGDERGEYPEVDQAEMPCCSSEVTDQIEEDLLEQCGQQQFEMDFGE